MSFGDLLEIGFNLATQPVRDGIEVAGGLTEGELREQAAMRLGADVVAGMALSELLEWYYSGS